MEDVSQHPDFIVQQLFNNWDPSWPRASWQAPGFMNLHPAPLYGPNLPMNSPLGNLLWTPNVQGEAAHAFGMPPANQVPPGPPLANSMGSSYYLPQLFHYQPYGQAPVPYGFLYGGFQTPIPESLPPSYGPTPYSFGTVPGYPARTSFSQPLQMQTGQVGLLHSSPYPFHLQRKEAEKQRQDRLRQLRAEEPSLFGTLPLTVPQPPGLADVGPNTSEQGSSHRAEPSQLSVPARAHATAPESPSIFATQQEAAPVNRPFHSSRVQDHEAPQMLTPGQLVSHPARGSTLIDLSTPIGEVVEAMSAPDHEATPNPITNQGTNL
ncbi:hypothetical protein VNI00_016194 [Paramarasmius palmivorus]|uniref:Uncharacterized protein n=1 Tax=Paramarasmius palmivorus TaxID=297713 RepID=A0AAW0BFF8_9AGAR